jgi:hypothetical protein
MRYFPPSHRTHAARQRKRAQRFIAPPRDRLLLAMPSPSTVDSVDVETLPARLLRLVLR